MTWSQDYTPLGGIGLSALVAALPVVTLLGLLAFWHVRAQFAALAGLLVAGVIAVAVYQMPASLTLASAGYGAATGGRPDSPDAGAILRAVFWHSLALAILVGVLVMIQTYGWKSVVPGG